MSFTICNNASINLNFIIHVLDMYNKKEPYSKNEFLGMEELECNIIKIWNNIVEEFQPISSKSGNSSFVEFDRSLVIQKDLYRTLFKDTEEGYNEFLSVWNNYYKWWWAEGQGQNRIDIGTDDVIPIIYNLIDAKLAENNVKPIGNFAIQVIFNKIPNGCLAKGAVFTIESIDKFFDKNKVNEVAERLYELMCSNVEK